MSRKTRTKFVGDPPKRIRQTERAPRGQREIATKPSNAQRATNVVALSIEERFRQRFEWVKVRAPQPWQPAAGEELGGYYCGRTIRTGSFGQYEVVLIAVPRVGMFTASGSELIRLIDSALLTRGHPVRILFKGLEQSKTNAARTVRHFELLISAGNPIPEHEIPSFT